MIYVCCAALMLSSCGTYTGQGAYTGATLGTILGSAIGGISDGPRGSDWGTLVGMIGGAVVGGAIGNAADQQKQRDMEEYQKDRAERMQRRQQQRQNQYPQGQYQNQQDADGVYGNGNMQRQNHKIDVKTVQPNDTVNPSGFDPNNSADDRIYDFGSSDYTGDYSAQQPEVNYPTSTASGNLTYSPSLEVRNARFVDDNQDGKLNAGEVSKIIFEVRNTGNNVATDVVPTVVEMTGNSHIYVSPSIHIEQIGPGRGIRYTAMVKADSRLRRGTAKFCVSVLQGDRTISKITEFNIPTSK